MATSEEIRQRVKEVDTARSVRRAAAAQQIGDLARRRAAIVEQLVDVERELGDVVADAQDVIDVDELAAFTDLKPAELTGWLVGHKATRGKRKKPTTATAREGEARRFAGPRTPLPEPGSDSRQDPATAVPSGRLVAQTN